MRISDWSSDVCSSDLYLRRTWRRRHGQLDRKLDRHRRAPAPVDLLAPCRLRRLISFQDARGKTTMAERSLGTEFAKKPMRPKTLERPTRRWLKKAGQRLRSEVHTSELQSLMRSSSAVVCLNEKTTLEDRETKTLQYV